RSDGRRPRPSLEGLHLAQPASGRASRPHVLRRPRVSPPGPDRDAGASARSSVAAGGSRWTLAVHHAGAGGERSAGMTRILTGGLCALMLAAVANNHAAAAGTS